MELEDKTILVTGAGGNVGSAVATRLVREGAKVKAMSRSRNTHLAGAEMVICDLTDPVQIDFSMKGVDMVVHCAASLSNEPEPATRGNIDATRNLLSGMYEHKVPMLVHVSTISVYDMTKGPELEEGAALCTDSRNAYGFTKAKAEGLVRASGLKHVILRPPAVLSTHKRSYWGPLAIARAKKDPFPVWPFRKLPYVHVDNLADAVVLSLTTQKAWGRVYNAVEGDADSATYLKRIYELAGKPVPELTSKDEWRIPSIAIRSAMKWNPRDLYQSFLAELKAV